MAVHVHGRHMETRIYTPEATRQFERLVGESAQQAGVMPLAGPVAVEVDVWISGRRGDGDNYLKSILDGLNGIAWEDDAQVVEASIRIHRAAKAAEERTEVVVREAS